MSEKYIQCKVVEYAKSKGIKADKYTTPSTKGMPDFIFYKKEGGIFFMEFKRQGCNLTSLQSKTIDVLQNKYKQKVFVVDDIEFGKNIIDKEILSEK